MEYLEKYDNCPYQQMYRDRLGKEGRDEANKNPYISK
jgi:hypothetical protein